MRWFHYFRASYYSGNPAGWQTVFVPTLPRPLGDGFGTKIEDMRAAQMQNSGLVGMTVYGAFHNGPLTTIRYCGIIGLAFFMRSRTGGSCPQRGCCESC